MESKISEYYYIIKERPNIMYSTFEFKLINEIEELLLLLANKLIKNGKYEIYLITNKDKELNFLLDKNIKMFRIMPNKTE